MRRLFAAAAVVVFLMGPAAASAAVAPAAVPGAAPVRSAAAVASAAPAPAAPSAPPGPPGLPASGGSAKPLTLAALRNLIGVAEPKIAPDGKRVVYVRHEGDYKADVDRTELVLVDLANGNAHRILTHDRDDVSSPSWSPDGTRIAFLAASAKDQPPEIYVISLAGGDAERITHARGAISALAWRPDGRALAYLMRDPANGASPAPAPSPSSSPGAAAAHAAVSGAQPDAGAPSGAAGRSAAADSGAAAPPARSPRPAPSASPTPRGYVEAFTVTDEHYLTRAPSRSTHVWTIDADGAHARQITHGAPSQGGTLEWLRDASAIVTTEQPDPVFAHLTKTHTVLVDVANGTTRPLRANAGADGGGLLSPDGTRLALAVPRHGSLYLQSDAVVRRVADGADVANGVALDRNVHWEDWQDDRTVLVGAADGVREYLYRLPLDGGAPARVELGELDFGDDASVARDGTIAFVARRTDAPGELYVMRRGERPVAVTDENAWARGYALGRTERVDWTSDGLHVCGALTYPVGAAAGARYPLVLVIHGGPVATSYRDFSPLPQLLAARGMLVLQPNYRGSDDAGDAFLQAIVGPVTSGPGRDNLAGVEAVRQLGIVDSARIGVSGWSGGGLQTSWLIGHATFWRAALSGAAVDDWFEQATLADIGEEFASTFLGGVTPWTPDGRAKYRAESPITYAADVKTPTLIMTDSSDQRVPISQSFAFYRALQGHGVDVKLVELPRAGHNPTDPVGRETRLRIWTDWFAERLK